MQVKHTPYGKAVESVIADKSNDKQQYKIATMKRYSGVVSSTVTLEKIEGDFITYTFGDYNKSLIKEKIRATINNLKKQHEKAIEIFKNEKPELFQ